jgi:hypothetical protein
MFYMKINRITFKMVAQAWYLTQSYAIPGQNLSRAGSFVILDTPLRSGIRADGEGHEEREEGMACGVTHGVGAKVSY